MSAPIDIGFAASTSAGAQSGSIGGNTITGGGRGGKWWQTVLIVAVAGAILFVIVKAWRKN